MRARSADLATLYGDLAYSYEQQGRRVPYRWRLLHRLVAAILRWGAR